MSWEVVGYSCHPSGVVEESEPVIVDTEPEAMAEMARLTREGWQGAAAFPAEGVPVLTTSAAGEAAA